MSAESKYSAEVCPVPGPARLDRRSVLGGIAGVGAGAAAVRIAGALGGVAASLPSTAAAETPALEVRDVVVPGFDAGFRQVRLLVPAGKKDNGATRGLILLHGLGETHRAALALRAWPELYGAASADERLRRPPVQPLNPKDKFWRASTLDAVNSSLHEQAYRGAVLICPRTPNPSSFGDRRRLFDDYAAWLVNVLVPAVEEHLLTRLVRVGLDGCSLGGYVAMEVYCRRASAFSSFGTVQGALGRGRVPGYAQRLTELQRKTPFMALRVASSEGDPYLTLNRDLSQRLTQAGVEHTFDVDPGPHNQPWLREVGTLRTLLWHDRQLYR